MIQKKSAAAFLSGKQPPLLSADFANDAERCLLVTLTEGVVLENF